MVDTNFVQDPQFPIEGINEEVPTTELIGKFVFINWASSLTALATVESPESVAHVIRRITS